MDQQKRLFITLGATMALLVAWQFFFAPKPPVPGADVSANGHPVTGKDAETKVAPEGEATTPPTQADGTVPPAPEGTPAPAPLVKLTRPFDLVHYGLTSKGAAVDQATLHGEKMREHGTLTVAQGYQRLLGKEIPKPAQMDLAAAPKDGPAAFTVGVTGGSPLPADLMYRVDEEKSAERHIVFVGEHGPWEITKTYDWAYATPFEFDLTVTVKNRSAKEESGELGFYVVRGVDPTQEEKPSMLGSVGNESSAACWVGDKMHSLLPDHDAPEEPLNGAIGFTGINQQYFLSALYAKNAAMTGRCVLFAAPHTRRSELHVPLQVKAGESKTFAFGAYMGPKDVEILASLPGALYAGGEKKASSVETSYRPPLEKTVDFGIWAVLCKLQLGVMKQFFKWTGNWGLAVILLTVLVKLILVPLTYKSMVSAEAMKKLQPRMEEIRKKHPDDKQRQQMEQMKLFQEAKVNPLGGCLPMLLQMPVWFALFTTLRTSFELYREPFFAPFITDLTFKDPTYILPVLLGVTMVVTQRLQPQMGDAAQAKLMNWFMPIMFTAFMLNYPAGLTLYIFTNNLLSIGQTYALRKWLARGGKA